MGNKPAGQKIKSFFGDVGNRIESGFHDFESSMSPIVNRLGQIGDKALGLVDHALDAGTKLEDAVGNVGQGIGKGFDGLGDSRVLSYSRPCSASGASC